MNSLSWFIYLSDIVGNFQTIFGIGAFMMLCAAGACMLARFIEEWEPGPAYAKRWAIAASICVAVSAFLPSSKTMYAIAASEVGEQIVKSEDVKGMASEAKIALRQWIKRQIEPEPKK